MTVLFWEGDVCLILTGGLMKKQRPTEMEVLIQDYYRDNRLIKQQKYKWLSPQEFMKGYQYEEITKEIRDRGNGKNHVTGA